MSGTPGQPPLDPQWAAESHLTQFLVITGILHAIALISVGLRLYCRIGLLRSPGKDDVAMGAAALMALGGWICLAIQGYHGLGRHTKTISKYDLQVYSKIGFFQSLISAIGALGFLKISIALFLLRLSKNKWYTRSLWALIGFIVFYTIGAWLTFLLRCRPMSGAWNKTIKSECYSLSLFVAVALANSGFNIFTDVCFASLPVPIIWSLQMSQRTRLYLIFVLSLGYVAVAMGIVKTVYQRSTNKDTQFNAYIQFWGYLQLNVGIIAANIPTMKPLLKKTRSASSGDRYNQFDAPSNNQRPGILTIGSGPQTPRRSRHMPFLGSMYTANDEGAFEMGRHLSVKDKKHLSYSAGAKSSAIYSVDEERAGSEDLILHDDRGAGGIMRTMQVDVVVGEAEVEKKGVAL